MQLLYQYFTLKGGYRCNFITVFRNTWITAFPNKIRLDRLCKDMRVYDNVKDMS